jgi:hypothetical protein
MVRRRRFFRPSLTVEEDDEPLWLPRGAEEPGTGGRVSALDERPGDRRALGIGTTAAPRYDEKCDERERDP